MGRTNKTADNVEQKQLKSKANNQQPHHLTRNNIEQMQAAANNPSLMTPAIIQRLQSLQGNAFVTRVIQRQEEATDDAPPHQDPRADAPNLWTVEEFQDQMQRYKNRFGDWVDDAERGLGIYDDELFEIEEKLAEYHTAANGDNPESIRLKSMFDLVNKMLSISDKWMKDNGDSGRFDEMILFKQQLLMAKSYLQVTAQPYLGTEYVFGDIADLDYVQLRALDHEIQALIAQTENEQDLAALNEALTQTRENLNAKVNEIFASFPEEILANPNFGMPVETNDRIEFLEYMAIFLGSIDNVIQHYSDMRKAAVPGIVVMHKSAASRIEQVAGDLGGLMPASWVALGVRDRFHVHNPRGNGLMAHPLGYAVDYRANDNPMLTGKNFDLASLDARMQTGDPNASPTMDLGASKARRELIAKMGSGEATPEEIEEFEKALEAEYERLEEQSDNFGSALGPDAAEDLKALHTNLKDNQKNSGSNIKEIAKVQASIDKLQKKKELSEEEAAQLQELQSQMQELEATFTALQQELYEIWQSIQSILAPYIEQIEAEQEALGEDVNAKVEELLGEAFAKLDDLEGGIQKDIDAIIASETSDAQKLEAYETFFKNYKDSYATLAAEAQTALADEETSRSKKKKMLVIFQDQIDNFNALEKQFIALKANIPSPDSEADEPPPLSGEMHELMQSAKSSLFTWFDLIVGQKQSKEASKLSGRAFKNGDLRQWRDLERLKNSLMWDAHFLFVGSRDAKDPSVVRMLETGYFNPDEAVGEGEKFNPNKHGFDLEFINAMAQRGFDLALAWSSVADAMHFELVDGVDALPPDRKATKRAMEEAHKDLINRGVLPHKKGK